MAGREAAKMPNDILADVLAKIVEDIGRIPNTDLYNNRRPYGTPSAKTLLLHRDMEPSAANWRKLVADLLSIETVKQDDVATMIATIRDLSRSAQCWPQVCTLGHYESNKPAGMPKAKTVLKSAGYAASSTGWLSFVSEQMDTTVFDARSDNRVGGVSASDELDDIEVYRPMDLYQDRGLPVSSVYTNDRGETVCVLR